MRFRVEALVGLLLFSSGTARAEPLKINLPWDCPLTKGTKGPGPQTFILEVDPKTGKSDCSKIESFFKKLDTDYPDSDFFLCAGSFNSFAYTAITSQCGAIKDEEAKSNCWAPIERFKGMTAEYNSRSYGRLPHFAPGKRLSTKLSADDKATMMRDLTTKGWCTNLRDTRLLSAEILDELPGLAPKIPENCRKPIERFYANRLLQLQLDAKQCKRDQKRCDERRSEVMGVVKQLRAAGFEAYKTAGFDQLFANGCPRPDEILEVNRQIEGVYQALDDDKYCKKPEVGGDPVPLYDFSGPVGELKKKSDKPPTFEVRYKINFILPETPAEGPRAKWKEADWLKFVQGCFKEAGPNLKGKNGEKLELVLDTSLKGVDGHTIRIDPGGEDRTNDSNWMSDVDCPTVLHETTHVFGAADEYEEIWEGQRINEEGRLEEAVVRVAESEEEEAEVEKWNATFKSRDNCRAVGPPDSLMRDQYGAYEKAFPKRKLTMCLCRKKSAKVQDECLGELNDMDYNATQCPAQTETYVETVKVDPKTHPSSPGWAYQYTNLKFPKDKDVIGRVIKDELVPNPNGPSLLYPAHFRLITNPGCTSEYKTYKSCIREKHSTSRQNYGSFGCSVSMPEDCFDKGGKWLQ